MKRSKIYACLGGAALVVAAGAASAAAAWTGPAQVTEVWAGYTSGYVFVRGPSNAAGCSNPLIKFSSTTSDPDRIQQVAIAAYMSGKKLDCVVDGCDGNYQLGKQCVLRD
jgi:hypothetical protein